MPRTSQPQAMFAFQHLTRELGSMLELTRTGKFWELWEAGEDFGMNRSERQRLAKQDPGYFKSTKIGSIEITANGSIRSLNFGEGYEGLTVLEQLTEFVQNHIPLNQWTLSAGVTVEQNGGTQLVRVTARSEVVVDDDIDEEGFSVPVFGIETTCVAQFVFDPRRNLLIGCSE